MTKPEILVIPEMLETLCDEFARDFVVHRFWKLPDRAALSAVAGTIRGIATNGQCGAGTDIIGALPQLEIISCYGVGVDRIDLAAAKERRIVVTTTPDVLTADVADMAIALLLASSRELLIGDRFVRSGGWLEAEKPVAQSVTGKKLGIYGMGRIGRAVARRAAAFDLEIAYHDREKFADVPFQYVEDLETLAAESDFLVVTCAATPSTVGSVNRRVVEALGPTGTLINVARGSIVDETALVEALQSGCLGGAALDVFAHEPNVPDALKGRDNAILQPHQGSGTQQCRAAMADLVIENLRGHFLGAGAKTPL
jgi:lactate dehydrogenase-like 2-hydroxyacid dehydrogenase